MEITLKTNQEIRNLVLFMCLGDGYLNKNNGYLAMRHCVAQKDYIDWKRDLLKKNLKVTDLYYVENNGYGAFELRTKTYKFIKTYRKILYPNNVKKIANIKILNKLTPLGLAIWYMDDGGLSQKKEGGVVTSNDLILNTHLSKEDNQIIIDYFNNRWGISFTQVKNKRQYRLRCGTREARKFLDIVRPYVSQVKSMEHKLNVKKLSNKST